jgi:hypothetical protein
MADPKRVLIIGETPERVDFSDAAIPPGTTPEKIRRSLEKSLNALRAKGCDARLVYLDDEDSAPARLDEAIAATTFDVIVVGAGLRIVPKQTAMFERVINIVHEKAPQARIAFNTAPDDSAAAAERVLTEEK